MLNYEEFFEAMWDYVSTKVVNDHYFFEREDMMRAITKDIYDIYCNEDASINPKFYGRTVESIFFHLIKHENEKEEVDYNNFN